MTIYTFHYTDPNTDPFVVNPYTTNGLRSPISELLAPGAVGARTPLLWYGKGSPNYGERIQENILHVLENFAGATAPTNPVSGQLWFERQMYFHGSNSTTGAWYVWEDNPSLPNGGDWAAIAPGDIGSGASLPTGSTLYWVNTSTSPFTFYQRVTDVGHPLENQWVPRSFFEDQAWFGLNGAPTASDFTPHQVLNVQTIVRTNLADSANWTAVNSPIASQIAPFNPTNGTLWFDTSDSTLKIYDGSWTNVVGDFLPIAGGTMTGFITLHADPTLPAHAATKLYVDTAVLAAIGVSTLDDLGDVVITGSPIFSEYLKFDGANWVNGSILWNEISDISVTQTEVGYLSGVSGNIQTQLNDRVSVTGDAMSGILSMTGNRITNLGTPTAATDAATKGYVDSNERYVTSGSYNAQTDILTLNVLNSTPVNVSGFGANLVYETDSSELLSRIPPFPPTDLNTALHDMDDVVQRRTTFTRQISSGHTGTTLTVPHYEVGSHKLFVFVDGIKAYANQRGYQRVTFNPSLVGSPSDPSDHLDCAVMTTGLIASGSPALVYTFEVAVDGGAAQLISVVGDSDATLTFCSLVAEINIQLTGARAVLEDKAIVFYSNTSGAGSSISVTDGSGGSPNIPLLANLNYFNAIETAVAGATYGYTEVTPGSTSIVGAISTTIEFTSALTAPEVVEVIVCGQTGFPPY